MLAPRSKRTLTILAFFSLVFTMIGVFLGLIPPAEQANATASLLFALHGGRGYVVADSNSPTGYKLMVAEVEPEVVWFTDRPERLSGTMLTAKLAQEWPSFFPVDDEPNAVIMGRELGDERESVVEMAQPVYDPRYNALIADISFVGEDTALKPVDDKPVEIGGIDVFIDDAVIPLPTATPTASAAQTTPAPATTTASAAQTTPAPATTTASPTTSATTASPAPSTSDSTSASATVTTSAAAAATQSASPSPTRSGRLGTRSPSPSPTSTGTTSQQGGGPVVIDPSNPLSWTFSSVIVDPSREDRRFNKTKLGDNILTSTDDYIYSIPAVDLISNFSVHHLDAIATGGGITLSSHTYVDTIGGS